MRIFEIFPPKPLASNALGSKVSALNRDYHLGRRCGRYFLATVGHWLLEQEKADGIAVKTPLSRRLIQPDSVAMPSPIVSEVARTPVAASGTQPDAQPQIVLPHGQSASGGEML